MESMHGRRMFDGIRDKGIIVMAANTRMSLVTEGIFQAAKEADSVVMIELAKSESDLKGGYTGFSEPDWWCSRGRQRSGIGSFESV